MTLRPQILIPSLLLLAACAHHPVQAPTEASHNEPLPAVPEMTSAQVQLQAAPKVKVKGSFTLTKTETGVLVKGNLSGLKKNSVHGLHVHEAGECVGPDFKSAGGHYNPAGRAHGHPTATEHHAGDFGNVTADKHGKAYFEMEFQDLSISGATNPIIGRSIVLHAKGDDGKTQPTGGSGDRIACGVIEASTP